MAQAVIRRYLLIAGLYTLSASVIWGVNTLFLLAAGLDLLGVFTANAVFTGSMALFEIPTGVLADARGRRLSFLLSVSILAVGTLGYVAVAELGGGLLGFCLMSVVLGLGFTFYSGAVEAWLVDALHHAGYAEQLDRVFAQGALVTGAAMLVGSIGGGVLGSVSLALPYVVRAGLLATVFGVAFFTMHDLGFTAQPTTWRALPSEMRRIARQSLAFGWRNNAVRLLLIASAVQAVFLAWGFYAWQPYFLELLGQNLAWVAGVVAALVALATMLGNSLVDRLTRYCGKRTTLLLWAAGIHAVAAVGVGLVSSFWLAVSLYLVAMVTVGVWEPVKQAFLHQSVPSQQRASVVSFNSLLSSGGSMAGQIGLGRLAQTQSLSAGYIAGGLLSFLVVPVVARLRGLNDPTDLIVGTAGQPGTCAAQGVPSIAAVDPNPAAVAAAVE